MNNRRVRAKSQSPESESGNKDSEVKFILHTRIVVVALSSLQSIASALSCSWETFARRIYQGAKSIWFGIGLGPLLRLSLGNYPILFGFAFNCGCQFTRQIRLWPGPGRVAVMVMNASNNWLCGLSRQAKGER